ncbi:MAG: type IV toxin-antitoxin system AbiEi family antitoxin [Rickettsiales bacterium]
MSTYNKSKINQLLSIMPKSTVVLSSWLAAQGYSLDLQKRYRKSQWFESIGTDAMIRSGDVVDYRGALYALQKYAGRSIHIGGRTALSLHGLAHYLELAPTRAVLFGGDKEKLPAWFNKHDWRAKICFYPTSFLPPDMAICNIEIKDFGINISTAERAIMECLYLTPDKQMLLECYELMEGLNTLRPKVIQQLLEHCTSIKVKRLFLYLANKAGHAWMDYIDLKKVDLGIGKRSLVKNGVYVAKYQITIPKELAEYVVYH